MKNLKYVLLTTIFIISISSIFSAEDTAFEISDFSLHIKITEMTKSEEPFISGENIIFSYTPVKQGVRHVGIAFENENFSQIYNLYRNENGVFFYIYKYPKTKEIRYKFVVDGVWTADSINSKVIRDKNFIKLSSFTIPDKNIKEHLSPIINDDTIIFKFRGMPGSSVYLTGDFNNWNPFIYKLKEEVPGEYIFSLTLPKGKFAYYFIYNGERVLDSENPFAGMSRLGEKVSLFTVE